MEVIDELQTHVTSYPSGEGTPGSQWGPRTGLVPMGKKELLDFHGDVTSNLLLFFPWPRHCALYRLSSPYCGSSLLEAQRLLRSECGSHGERVPGYYGRFIARGPPLFGCPCLFDVVQFTYFPCLVPVEASYNASIAALRVVRGDRKGTRSQMRQ
jgi:hypothetical protein